MADKTTTYVLEGDTTSLVAAVDAGADALEKLEKDANKTTKAVDKTGKESKKAAGGVDKLGKSSLFTAKNAGKLAVGILAAGAALGGMLQKMADAQNQLSNLSLRTGVATDTLAGLKLAAAGSGQTLEDMQSVLEPMIERIGQAAETAAAGFRGLGVDVLDTEGNMKSADQVLKEVSKGLASMEDPTKRAAAAALAFGGAGTKLVQALGTTDLAAFVEMADRFGIDTGPRAAQAAANWEQAQANLKLVMEPFAGKLMEVATKKVQDFTVGVIALKAVAREGATTLHNLGENFLAIATSMQRKEGQSWTEWLMQDMDEFKARFADLKDPAEGFVRDMDAIGTAIAEDVSAFLTLNDAMKKTIEKSAGVGVGLDENKDNAKDLAKTWGTLTAAIDAGADALDAIAESNRFGLTEEDKLRDAYDKKIEKLGEIEAQTRKNLALIDEEIAKAKEKGLATEELTEAQREGALSLMRIDGQRLASIDALGDALEKLDNTQAENLENVATTAKAYEEAFGAAIDFVMSQNEVMTKAQRNGLLVLYRLQQAAAITSIIIDTATGIMKYAALGPVGIPGGVAIGVLGAAQVAAVTATPPPFHVGGIIPDGAGLASVLPGESVLTREATAKLGTEGVRDLNSGMGSPTIVVEQVYKHKIFDSFVQDNINKGGPLASAIRGTSRVGRA